jgi:hypothetical protein
MTMTPAAIAAILAQETEEVFLSCCKITHPTLTDAIRVVNSKVNLTHGGELYTGMYFTVRLPNDSEEGVATVTLTIQNVDRLIVEAVRNMAGGVPPVATFFVVLASSPNSIELGPFEVTMRDIKYDFPNVTGTCTWEDHLNQRYPAHSFTPNRFPGLF